MGIEVNIDNNLSGDSINVSNMLTSFDAQNNLVDQMLDNELYNQELYNGGIGERYNNKEPQNDFYKIVNHATDFQRSKIVKLANIDVSNISMSYNKTADMYRNQYAVDRYVESKMNKFKKRNKHLLEDVDNKIRQKEIYTYYYKKYNAQKKILLNIVFGALLVIGLSYLNKNYNFLLTDTLFILALGLIFAVIAINICSQLIEIFFRNNINFDEYDFMFDADLNSDYLGYSNKEKEMQDCDVEIKAYQGR